MWLCIQLTVQQPFGGGGGGGTDRRGGRGGNGAIGCSRILGFGLCFFFGCCDVAVVLSSPLTDVPLCSACFWFLKARFRSLSSSSKGKFRSICIFFRFAGKEYGKSKTVPIGEREKISQSHATLIQCVLGSPVPSPSISSTLFDEHFRTHSPE